MRAMGVSIVVSCVLATGSMVAAREGGETASVWDLGTVAVGASYPTTLGATNASCPGKHSFEISIENAPWLRLTGPARLDKIKPGESKQTPAVVDLRDMVPGEHDGTVHIRCVTCPPTCRQTATTLEVRLVAVDGETAEQPSSDEPRPPEETAPPDESPQPADPGGDPSGRSSSDDRRIVPGAEDEERKIADEACALSSRMTQVYSRGQNNDDQMKEQIERAGTGILEYETAQMKLEWSLESACECRDRAEGDPEGGGARLCSGDIDVKLAFWVTNLDPKFAPELIGTRRNNKMREARAMVPVSPPSTDDRTREIPHDGEGPLDPVSGDPRPSVRMHLEERYGLPKGGNPFTAEGDGYVVRSSTKIPCTPGEHSVRFLMVDNDVLSRSMASVRKHTIDGNLQIVADANVAVAQEKCTLELKNMESFLVEFRRDYEFGPVTYKNQKGQLVEADPTNELPRVELTVEGSDFTTYSLLKLIASGGRTVGKPFPPRQEGVRPEDD